MRLFQAFTLADPWRRLFWHLQPSTLILNSIELTDYIWINMTRLNLDQLKYDMRRKASFFCVYVYIYLVESLFSVDQ